MREIAVPVRGTVVEVHVPVRRSVREADILERWSVSEVSIHLIHDPPGYNVRTGALSLQCQCSVGDMSEVCFLLSECQVTYVGVFCSTDTRACRGKVREEISQYICSVTSQTSTSDCVVTGLVD